MDDPRVLTQSESDAYAARLATVGFTFTPAGDPEPTGFDVTDGAVVYNYRYDGTATTAVELMDRICGERGC